MSAEERNAARLIAPTQRLICSIALSQQPEQTSIEPVRFSSFTYSFTWYLGNATRSDHHGIDPSPEEGTARRMR